MLLSHGIKMVFKLLRLVVLIFKGKMEIDKFWNVIVSDSAVYMCSANNTIIPSSVSAAITLTVNTGKSHDIMWSTQLYLPSLYSFIYTCIYIGLSVCLSVYLSIYLFICLAICLSMYLHDY